MMRIISKDDDNYENDVGDNYSHDDDSDDGDVGNND